MERFIVTLTSGRVVEFEGKLVARATREKPWDARRSTVFQYELYKTAEGRLVLVLETYEKIQGKSFVLNFNSPEDAKRYVGEDGDDEVVRQLFGKDVD
jgi:hypothetical protein